MPLYYVESQPEQGADKYHGAVASGYDAKREQSPKWTIEQKIIEGWIDELADGSWVLDIPCGTGRFFEAYERNNHCYHGVDKSTSMLEQAALKANDKARLKAGDVRKVPLEDKSVDMPIMCRLTRWLSPEDCVKALKELQRVTRKKIVFTARVRNHPHARTYDLINSALDGWKITKDETGADMDYRIIMVEPV